MSKALQESAPKKKGWMQAVGEALQTAAWKSGKGDYARVLCKIHRLRREAAEAEYKPIECEDCKVPVQEDHTCPVCGQLVVEDEDTGKELRF